MCFIERIIVRLSMEVLPAKRGKVRWSSSHAYAARFHQLSNLKLIKPTCIIQAYRRAADHFLRPVFRRKTKIYSHSLHSAEIHYETHASPDGLHAHTPSGRALHFACWLPKIRRQAVGGIENQFRFSVYIMTLVSTWNYFV